jgi:lipase
MAVLHHDVYGDGERTVVAVHGIRAHGARWRRLAGLVPEATWTAVDLRGHGHSPWTPPWTLEQHTADLLDTLDARGLSTVDLIGHSFGGAVALWTAAAAPHRIRRLLLLDPGLALPPEDALRAAEAECLPITFPDRDTARAARAAGWPAADPALVDEELDAHLEETPDGRWRWRFAAPAVVTALSEMCRTPPPVPPGVPTTLVTASRGSVTGPDFLAALPPTVHRVTLESGHVTYVDNPDGTAAVVREFLERG